MTVKKIISGGQTGADQGGLAAGKELGLETGGFAPHNFRTDTGPNPKLRIVYGLCETASRDYPPRTKLNVKGSDGTVIFGNSDSPGSKLTLRLCKELKKPYLILSSEVSNAGDDDFGFAVAETAENFREWLAANRIEILNVAGNRERSNPGIFERVKSFLIEALKEG